MNEQDFDLAALYKAVDEKRASLGMSWAAVTREINALACSLPRRRLIATSTITGLKARTIAEGDGVLQLLLWLGRTPESFVRGSANSQIGQLRRPGTNQILRWDTHAMFEALNAKRCTKGLSWVEVARQIGGLGINSGTLTRLSKGGRTTFPHVMRVVRWLGEPAASFTRASDW